MAFPPNSSRALCGWRCYTLGVTIRLLITIALLAGITAAAQSLSRPSVPDEIKASGGEDVVLIAHATGSQIYTCSAGTGNAYAWKLKAPEAELRDAQGTLIGHHFAGPTWKHNDGSEVTGKMSAKADSPDKDSIPWLLVAATGHSGNGAFSHVTTIQRIHTKGGQPPAASECTASKQGSENKSAYTADYYFYAPAK